MQKKIGSLVALFCLVLFSVLAFVPCVFRRIFYEAETPGRGIFSQAGSKLIWMFGRYPVLGILVMILVIIGIVALVLHYQDSDKPFLKKASYAPAAALVVFVALGILGCVFFKNYGLDYDPDYYGFYIYKPSGGFYVMCVCLFTAGVLSVLLALGKLSNEPYAPAMQPQPQVIYYVQQPVQAAPQAVQVVQPQTVQVTQQTAQEPVPPYPEPIVQPQKPVPMPIKPAPRTAEVRIPEDKAFDLVKKYKDLLDSGIITQEEYDAKKKELLRL